MNKLLSFLLKLTLIIWIVAAAAIFWFGPVEAATANNGPPPKVTICHVLIDPPQTIEVPAKAVSAHLAHSDYLGACVEPTPTPTPTEPPPATPEPPRTALEPATGLLWLLTNQIGGVNQHCLIFSDNGHPSVERQNALCFRELTGGTWVAENAPCAAKVYSMYPGDAEGFWKCDRYTSWRLPLATLRPIYAKHANK